MGRWDRVRFLLDTHVVLWLAQDADKVPAALRQRIADADHRWVSSASAMEIAAKTRLGKLPGGHALLDRWAQVIEAFMAQELPLTVAHMTRAGLLDWDHRDPFDRMLVAQAQREGLQLVTKDERLQSFAQVQTADWK